MIAGHLRPNQDCTLKQNRCHYAHGSHVSIFQISDRERLAESSRKLQRHRGYRVSCRNSKAFSQVDITLGGTFLEQAVTTLPCYVHLDFTLNLQIHWTLSRALVWVASDLKPKGTNCADLAMDGARPSNSNTWNMPPVLSCCRAGKIDVKFPQLHFIRANSPITLQMTLSPFNPFPSLFKSLQTRWKPGVCAPSGSHSDASLTEADLDLCELRLIWWLGRFQYFRHVLQSSWAPVARINAKHLVDDPVPVVVHLQIALCKACPSEELVL